MRFHQLHYIFRKIVSRRCDHLSSSRHIHITFFISECIQGITFSLTQKKVLNSPARVHAVRVVYKE